MKSINISCRAVACGGGGSCPPWNFSVHTCKMAHFVTKLANAATPPPTAPPSPGFCLRLRPCLVNTNIDVTAHVHSYRSFGFERVYLPLYKVADTPFHIQRDDILETILLRWSLLCFWVVCFLFHSLEAGIAKAHSTLKLKGNKYIY